MLRNFEIKLLAMTFLERFYRSGRVQEQSMELSLCQDKNQLSAVTEHREGI